MNNIINSEPDPNYIPIGSTFNNTAPTAKDKLGADLSENEEFLDK